MEEKRGRKIFEILKHNLLTVTIFLVIISVISVFAGNVIVREGTITVENTLLAKTVNATDGIYLYNNDLGKRIPQLYIYNCTPNGNQLVWLVQTQSFNQTNLTGFYDAEFWVSDTTENSSISTLDIPTDGGYGQTLGSYGSYYSVLKMQSDYNGRFQPAISIPISDRLMYLHGELDGIEWRQQITPCRTPGAEP